MPTKSETTWALACHVAALSGFVGVPLGNVLGPLAVWLLGRNESPFVDEHGREALNFHISLVIYSLLTLTLFILPIFLFFGGISLHSWHLGLAGLLFLLLAFGVHVAIYVGGLYCTIKAAIRASEGQRYLYPFCLQLFR